MNFMISSRIIATSIEEWNASEDMFWLKEGTSFISKDLKLVPQIK